MALRWELRDAGAEVVVIGSGVITDADVLRQVTEILQVPDVMRDVQRWYSDFTDAERIEVATETIHTIAAVAHQVAAARLAAGTRPAIVRVAQVGTSDLAYGLLRMFEMLFDRSGWRIATFRDRDEARAWLTGGSP